MTVLVWVDFIPSLDKRLIKVHEKMMEHILNALKLLLLGSHCNDLFTYFNPGPDPVSIFSA